MVARRGRLRRWGGTAMGWHSLMLAWRRLEPQGSPCNRLRGRNAVAGCGCGDWQRKIRRNDARSEPSRPQT